MLDLTVVAATDSALPAEPADVRHLIAGEWRASADGATFERRSPAHGTVVTRAAKGARPNRRDRTPSSSPISAAGR